METTLEYSLQSLRALLQILQSMLPIHMDDIHGSQVHM